MYTIKSSFILGVLCIVSSNELYGLKRALWENFQTQANLYQANKSEEAAGNVWSAYEALLDASANEAPQVWKDKALEKMNELYNKNPNYFKAYFIKNFDRFCRLPPKLEREIKTKLEREIKKQLQE
jgi:hypothetical protein